MELLADYYAIVRTMEKLEKAYIGGHVSDDRVYEQVGTHRHANHVPPSYSLSYHSILYPPLPHP